ncbi:MAG: hypothetical protein LKF88_02490 [Microbacteriaceae bacterium]|jgi:type II restriction enzyme|nr:hypothetical protein [Microbacteriaceae bacterium]
MAQKSRLRKNRYGTVINVKSSIQELDLGDSLVQASEAITQRFRVALHHETEIHLTAVVRHLRSVFPTIDFADPFERSTMKPDGGILSIQLRGNDKTFLPILITEVKNQGTNDLRLKEGKKKQAMGNAIERLGKNIIGFRTTLLDQGIFPFVCFGYGYDFQEGSSILDRVRTIAMFGQLNRINVINQGDHGEFNRGSFFFREEPWSKDEMRDIMIDVCTRSIHYYASKYGEDSFQLVDA